MFYTLSACQTLPYLSYCSPLGTYTDTSIQIGVICLTLAVAVLVPADPYIYINQRACYCIDLDLKESEVTNKSAIADFSSPRYPIALYPKGTHNMHVHDVGIFGTRRGRNPGSKLLETTDR